MEFTRVNAAVSVEDDSSIVNWWGYLQEFVHISESRFSVNDSRSAKPGETIQLYIFSRWSNKLYSVYSESHYDTSETFIRS